MCWFASGVTDAVGTDGADDGPLATVDCLGWVEDLACLPHATPERRRAFRDVLARRGQAGVALEDGCALELTDGEYRVRSVSGTERAHGYSYEDGELRVTELDEDGQFRDVATLR